MAASARPAACAGNASTSLHETSVATDRSRLATNPIVLYTLAFGLGLVLNRFDPQRILPDALAFGLGAAVLVAGGVLATWTNRTVDRARSARGAQSASTVLVTTGPFAFSRNPMRLARTLLYVGTALERNALWALATLIPVLVVIHLEVVRAEERAFERRFGDAYRQYCARVRRWV
jgi:protein-S-isoprenylcysteine O-methyltransferase Ste14